MTQYGTKVSDALINAWEHANVHARDRRVLPVEHARAVVGHVWQLCRMPGNPPSVYQLTPDHPEWCASVLAYVSCDTGAMYLQERCSTTIVLHELAHQLTDDPLAELECKPVSEREAHGRTWLANYLWLLDRLMGPAFNTFALRASMPTALRPLELPYYPVIRGTPRPGL